MAVCLDEDDELLRQLSELATPTSVSRIKAASREPDRPCHEGEVSLKLSDVMEIRTILEHFSSQEGGGHAELHRAMQMLDDAVEGQRGHADASKRPGDKVCRAYISAWW